MTRLQSVLAALTLTGAAAIASAERPAEPPPPSTVDIAELLDLDAARATRVQAILEASREKTRAAMDLIRAQTDAELATVLTAEELARLKATMPAPGVRRANI